MTPLRRYWLSVWMSTRHGRLSASSAEIAAISSMRLLVVWGSPPLSSLTRSPKARIAPQPPGPGLPEQAPSVWMTTCDSLKIGCPVNAQNSFVDPVVAHAGDGLMEAQLAEVFQRVLPPHQRSAALVEPIDQAGQQKPQRRAARQHRQRRPLLRR